MAQSLKDDIRRRILAAALDEFAERGWLGAGLQGIAARAGVSVGNIYRYYPSREALFDTVLPASTVEDIRRELLAKFRALEGLDLEAPAALALEEEWLPRLAASLGRRKRELLILVGGAKGTVWAGFAAGLAQDLANAYAVWRQSRGLSLDGQRRAFLLRLYRSLVSGMAAILADRDGDALEREIGLYLAYHMAGVRELERRWEEA